MIRTLALSAVAAMGIMLMPVQTTSSAAAPTHRTENRDTRQRRRKSPAAADAATDAASVVVAISGVVAPSVGATTVAVVSMAGAITAIGMAVTIGAATFTAPASRSSMVDIATTPWLRLLLSQMAAHRQPLLAQPVLRVPLGKSDAQRQMIKAGTRKGAGLFVAYIAFALVQPRSAIGT